MVLIPTLKRQHFRVLLQWLGACCSGLLHAAIDVAECALWSLCDFGEAILTSEIDAALTLQLRYSYHVREPARMYDYYMDSI